jgi:shikimate dehydrogenase
MLEIPKNAFVCGHPISHSRSPIIHNYWLKVYEISGSYRAVDVLPVDFAKFALSLAENGFVGGNITIPNKEAAFAVAARSDEVCKLIGAANTLWLEEGELCATNTDAIGFAANLDERLPGWDQQKSALVLGAGGASRAIIHALLERGFTSVRIANRSLARAVELKDRFGEKVTAHTLDGLNELAADAGIIINTTSLGMKGEGEIPLDMSRLRTDTLVTDVVYVPLMTPFLTAAEQVGLKVADGLGMLLHQAAPGFEKWFGVRPAVSAELRNRIIADMAVS